MKEEIERFFERYAAHVERALAGEPDMEAIAAQFAPAFVAATPAGIMGGSNDESLVDAMASGYARYREIGTRAMTIEHMSVMPIDEWHALAAIDWAAVYGRGAEPDLTLRFTVTYVVQLLEGTPKIFAWMSGDEDALLRQHGLV